MEKKSSLSRTKKAIVAALLGLMRTEPYTDITVTQIVQRAEIARRTFYLNYATKEDVIRDCIAEQAREYTSSLLQDDRRCLETDVLAFFEYWAKCSDLLLLLHSNGLFSLLLDAYERILGASDAFPYLNVDPPTDAAGAATSKYFNIMAATILWRVQLEWVRTGMEESASELAAITLELVPYSIRAQGDRHDR